MNGQNILVPPSDLEREVIGYMFLDDIKDRIPDIDVELFSPANKKVVECIKDVYEAHDDISPLSITEKLKEKHPKLNGQLTGIVIDSVGRVVSASGFEATYKTLAEQRKRIRALKMMQDTYRDLYSGGDIDHAIGNFSTALENLGGDSDYYRWGDIDDLLEEVRIENIPSAIREYRNKTGGYYKKQIHVYAARPGHGKTTHSANEAIFLSQRYRVAYFSLEMSAQELMQKILAISGNVNNQTIQFGGTIPSENLQEIMKTLDAIAPKEDRRNGLYIFDDIYDHHQIINTCKELKPDVIILDFLQFLDFSRYDEYRLAIHDMLRAFKRYIKRYNVVMIAYSQTSRDIEKRAKDLGRRRDDFRMSDVAESAYIEIAAGYLTFMRWVYLETGDPVDRYVLNMYIKKARFGGIGNFKVQFAPDKCIIEPPDDNEDDDALPF